MEDLFELYLGQKQFDSNYDISRIQDSVMVMLNPKAIIFENKINYIQEVQDWNLRRIGDLPERKFVETYGDYKTFRDLLILKYQIDTKSTLVISL